MCFLVNIAKFLRTAFFIEHLRLELYFQSFLQILFTLFKVYIYDIRSSSYLHQLKGFKDVVSTLTYHPQVPKVC